MKIHVEKVAALAGHRDCIYTLEGSDKPNIFFSAAGDGMVVRWDLQNPDIGKLIVKVSNSVYALCYIKEYNHLVVGENFEGIHVIDLASNKEIKSLKTGNTAIFDIQIFQDNLLVAFGNGDVSILDYNSLEVKKKITVSDKSARTIAINPACREFAVGFSDHYIRVFDLSEYTMRYEILGHENSVFTLSYSPDSLFLFSAGRDARLKKWDVYNGYSLENVIVAHMYAINNATFSPDSKLMASASMDKTIKIWDAKEMKLLKVVDKARHGGHTTSVNKLLWTNYQNELISCSDDKMISVWKFDFDKN